MDNKPFDLKLMDYKSIRRAKRKKYFLIALGPLMITFFAALWFILPQALTTKAIQRYDSGSYGSAGSWLRPLTITSPERFVISYNAGTTNTQLKKFLLAEEQLTQAVALAPDDKLCMAAQNLVSSMTLHSQTYEPESKEVAELLVKIQRVRTEYPECFKGASASGGGSSSASSDSQSLSKSQQQQLQQKEQEGRERQAQFASEEQYDPNDPSIKPW